MKKKILSICLAAVIAVMAITGASLAYLTDTDGADNVFTVGNIKIQQNEQERTETGLGDFTPNQTIVPAVLPETTTKEDVTVNDYTVKIRDNVANYVDKIISVTNTGKSDAYVRTFIAIPTAGYDSNNAAYNEWLHWNGVSNTDTNPNNGWMWGTKENGVEWPGNTDTWNCFTQIIDGVEYMVYVATNVDILENGKATAPCFVGFYLDPRVDCEETDEGLNYFITIDNQKYDLGDISNLEIKVATQAVQADGFADAWTALDSAFGTVTETDIPWAE